MKRARNEDNEIYRMHGVSLKVSPWRLWVQSAVLGVLVLILSLPAKAAVFNVGSGNVVALINAINLANANGEDDTINLEPGSYTLTQENNVTDGSNGLPSINTPIEIIGAGSDTTIIERPDGADYFRIFHVAAGGNLSLNGLSVEGGVGTDIGGGIFNRGDAALEKVSITRNWAFLHGNGIYNYSNMIIKDCSIIGNFLGHGDHGGGIFNNGTMDLINTLISGNFAHTGGGIYNENLMTLTKTTISDNIAVDFGGGGGIVNTDSGKMTLNETKVNGNDTGLLSGGLGGAGIRNEGEMFINNSTVSQNTAQSVVSAGGGIRNSGFMELSNTTIEKNKAFEGARGGGIFNSGTINLNASTVSGNETEGFEAPGGSGIYNTNTGKATLVKTTVSGNLAVNTWGAGIYNESDEVMIITDSDISGNGGMFPFSRGGGIFNVGVIELNNTNITGNGIDSVSGGGGGIENSGIMTLKSTIISGNSSHGACSGGGILNSGEMNLTDTTISGNQGEGGLGAGGIQNEGDMTLNNTTISDNKAFNVDPWSAGIYNTGTIEIKNTIVANNSPGGNCVNFGTFTPFGVNMATDDTCLGFTSVTAEQLNLGPLENNGGPTQTHALLPGSVAIDAVPDCTDVEGLPIITDQRSVTRPQDGDGNGEAKCDIGAYEKLPTLKILSDNTWKSWNSQPLDYSGCRDACAPYPYREDYPPSSWIPYTKAVYMWDHEDCPSATGQNGPNEAWFKKVFNIPLNYIIINASVVVAADDDFDFYVNGSKVYSDWNGEVWGAPYTVDIKPHLAYENHFEMYAKDSNGDWEWALVDATIEMRNLDFSNNGWVDRDDLLIILAYIRGPGPHYDISFDLNGDGKVNIADARKLVVLFTNP